MACSWLEETWDDLDEITMGKRAARASARNNLLMLRRGMTHFPRLGIDIHVFDFILDDPVNDISV
jgi:hypothetical protein